MSVAEMETKSLDMVVEFGLHQSRMEGRDGYTSGVRPNHRIPGRDYTFIGQVEFGDRKTLTPGESCVANMKCIVATQDMDLFKPGFTWHVCEANKIVGYARVIEC